MALFSFITDALFGSPPAAPAAPDYTGAAVAQGTANLDAARATAKLSNPNIYSPYGNQTVTYNNDVPTITQTLTPEAQKTLNEQQQGQYGLAALGNQGVANASQVFNTPFSFGGPSLQTSLGPAGDLRAIPDANQYGMAGSVDPNAYGQAGSINPNAYGQAGSVNANAYGQAQGGVAGPNLSNTLDTSNVARMPINAGTTAQQAIMSRLEPQLQRNRVSTETQLINQGLRPGSEAYNNAAQLLGQQENDQRTQAVLQGLGLDMSANAQGYGQALSTGQFGNAANLAGFNANLANQQAGNQAIAQNFGQGVTAQQMANQAVSQNFGQGLSAQQMQNAAIGQNFGQGVTAQQMQNQAIGQNYGQGLSTAQAQNAQVAQQFNINQQSAQFANTAQQQALAQAIQQRQLPLNEINALMSGSQIQNPQFQQYTGANVQAAPIANATAQQGAFNQNLYNQQTGTYNTNLAGLYSLGGAGAKAFA
jgi:hypothetical protein